ncbi:ROK family protein [Lentimicrobium sp.]|uniref:ROK family protein n=1 Tax=Lentimicrobium sp. TaxID=2034841 RepID=UPI0025D76035|nr:ROK family protein [Lentimicrobium sp.]MCO5256857.1 ROK family protein [Lentimicrobium sp.]HPR26983.1 ROK family protein [Lentimicrobium sp.]
MTKNKMLGFDIGGTNLRAGVIENGSVLSIYHEPIGDQFDEQGTINQVIKLISLAMSPGIVSIGVGVPSVVDLKTGVVYDTVNIPSWKEVPLKDILEEKFGIPVLINNDANCFVLGEKYFGSGKNVSNLTGLILGTGVGAGLIMNNKLVPGHNCGAGEFGMVSYLEHNYEYYCGGGNFEVLYGNSAVELSGLAGAGNPEALRIWNTYGKHLAELIKLVLYTADPQSIVLGGSLSQAYPFFKESMLQSLQTFAFRNTLKNLSIHVSELEYAGVLGAACLYNDSGI